MVSTTTAYRHDRRVDFIVSMTAAFALLGVGSIGVFRVLVLGDHGALTSYVPWGLWVGVYVYLVWLEVGMIISYFMLRRYFKIDGLEKLGPVVMLAAISALVAALFAIGMDLGHPFRFWRAYLTPNFGSLMTWMIWLHTIYLGILSFELYAYMRGKETVRRWQIYLNLATYVSIPIGVALIAVIGGLFGVVAARPFWNASVLPLMFFIASLVGGLGLITVLHLLFSPTKGSALYQETAVHLGRIFLGAIVVGAIAAFANALVIAYPNVPAHAEGLRLVAFGPYWWTIWIVHIGLGVLLPVALLSRWPESMYSILAGAGLYVLAFAMVPVNIIIPGLAYPMPAMEGLRDAFIHEKLTFSYAPSATEYLIVLFSIGIALTLFSLGYRYIVQPYFKQYVRRHPEEADIMPEVQP
jgi:protein NrfD